MAAFYLKGIGIMWINASKIISQVGGLCDDGWPGGWCEAVLVSGFIAKIPKNSWKFLNIPKDS